MSLRYVLHSSVKKHQLLAIEYDSAQYISFSPDILDVYNLFDKHWYYTIDLIDMSENISLGPSVQSFRSRCPRSKILHSPRCCSCSFSDWEKGSSLVLRFWWVFSLVVIFSFLVSKIGESESRKGVRRECFRDGGLQTGFLNSVYQNWKSRIENNRIHCTLLWQVLFQETVSVLFVCMYFIMVCTMYLSLASKIWCCLGWWIAVGWVSGILL